MTVQILERNFGCNLDDSLDTLDNNDFKDVLKDYLIHSFHKYLLVHMMCQVLCYQGHKNEQDAAPAFSNVSISWEKREVNGQFHYGVRAR